LTVTLEVGDDAVVVLDELEVDCDASSHLRVLEPFQDALKVDLVGEFLAELGQVVLAERVLYVGEQVPPFAHEMAPAAKQVAGRSHPGGVDISHWDHAASEQPRDLAGVDAVVFGLPPVYRLHV